MTAKFPFVGHTFKWMPFFSMLGAPVELMTKELTTSKMLEILGTQTAWAAVCIFVALRAWAAGVRRFEAVGG